MSDLNSCTPSTLYMKVKMPHNFLPESVAMPLACKNEDTALGLFQVTQSYYHNALKITWSHLLVEFYVLQGRLRSCKQR